MRLLLAYHKRILKFFKSASIYMSLAVLLFPSTAPALAADSFLLKQRAFKPDFKVDVRQDLKWGVLAINPDKSIYKVGEMAHFAMGVLDERGDMVCDAELELVIYDELGQGYMLSTERGIAVNPECKIKNYTTKPDFEADIQLWREGKYQLVLRAKTKNGIRTIYEIIEAKKQSPDFTVKRLAQTRLFPLVQYPVKIEITANKNFEGTIRETLPENFKIVGEPFGYKGDLRNALLSGRAGDEQEIAAMAGKGVIEYFVNLKQGEKATLRYSFDAPDISPEFYELGKLKLVSKDQQLIFEETRQWQFANDSVQFKQGEFAKRTSTGDQSITGLGFEPKAIIFYWTAQSTNDAFLTSTSTFGFGFATEINGATSTRSIAYCADSSNSGGNSDSAVRQSENFAIMIMQGSGNNAPCSSALVGGARFASMDSDGFTLFWSDANNQAYIIRYMAFGGSDITDATTSSFTLTTGTGEQAITGLGFAPDVLIYMGANTTTAAAAFNNNTRQGRLSLGWSTAATSTDQGVIGFTSEHDQGTSDTAMMSSSSASGILYLSTGNPPAKDGSFRTEKLNGDGFTVYKEDAVTNNTPVFYLAMSGGKWKGGNDTQQTSTATKATTGVGFKPEGVALMTWGLAASNSNTNNAVISFGGAGWSTTTETSATSSTGAIAFAEVDGDTTPDPDVGTWSTSTPTTIVGLTPVANASPTIASRGHVESFDSDGFTLNWTTANSTARLFFYLAVGSNDAEQNISGNVYSDEGINGLSNSRTIKLVVTNEAGTSSTTYSTTTVAGTGQYNFLNVTPVATATYTVYLDEAAEDAVVVTKSTGTPNHITGLNLYQNYLIIRHESPNGSATATNSELGDFDWDNDPDVPFSANSNNLTATSSTHVLVWTGKIYDPGGTVTTQSGGNFIVATSAIAFLDTATNSIGGNINIYGSATTSIDADTTVSGGSITTRNGALLNYSTGTPTITLSGSGSIGGGAATTTFYNLSATGSGTINASSTLVVNNNLNAGSKTWNIYASGTPLTVGGLFTASTSSFSYKGNGTTTPAALAYYNLDFSPSTNSPYTLGSTSPSWYSYLWNYRRPITIDKTKVSTASGTTLSNFPVLINLSSNSALAAHALESGADILFTSSDGTTKIPHEIEKYASSTGELVAWVKVSSLPTTSDTTIYMYYGNASSTSQQDATNVWDSNYRLVYHLPSSTTFTANDSTSNGNNSSVNTATGTVGQIDGGGSFNGSNTYIRSTSNVLDPSATDFSASAWFNITSTGTTRGLISQTGGGGTGRTWLYASSTGRLATDLGGAANNSSSTVTTGSMNYGVITKTGTSVKIYLNGSLNGGFTITTESASGITGIGTTTANGVFLGTLDEIRISNTLRSLDWIITEYNNQSNPSAFYTLGHQQAYIYDISNNFTIGDGNNAVTVDANSNNNRVKVGGTFMIHPNAAYSAAASASTTLVGNFVSRGAFTHNNGRVVFVGGSTSNISSDAHMTFYNLHSSEAGKTLQFQAHAAQTPRFTIAGTLELFGTATSTIRVQSTSSGSSWIVNFSSLQASVFYVSLMDCGCFAGSENVTSVSTINYIGSVGRCWGAYTSGGGGGGSPSGGEGSGGGGTQTGGGQGGNEEGEGGSGGGGTQTGGGQGGGGASP